MQYEYFPAEILALQEEVIQHPPLIALLHELDTTEWLIRLACIAAYCEVILDGCYSETDIKLMCDTLTQKLRDKRDIIIDTMAPRAIVTVPHLDAPSPEDPAASGKILLH